MKYGMKHHYELGKNTDIASQNRQTKPFNDAFLE